MRVLDVTENVKKLLLNSKFLEWVFDAPDEPSDIHSELNVSMQKILKKYPLGDILDAKYILLHLDEELGLISDIDMEKLKNRIKTHLKP